MGNEGPSDNDIQPLLINEEYSDEVLESTSTDDEEDEKVPLPLWRIICMLSWQVGITFGWNAMFVMGTPLFKSLEMSNFTTSFAWLAGPLSGLIFQPICCSISDRLEYKWGRRRPFILVGAVMGVLGMLLFAYPQELGDALGGGNTLSIIIAIVALWIMNIGLNIIQGPGWALVFDCLPQSQQSVGNAVLSVLGASAGLSAALLGAAPLTDAFPFLGTQQMALFWIGILLLISSVIPALVFAPEQRFVLVLDAEQRRAKLERLANDEDGGVRHCIGRFFRKAWRGTTRIAHQIFVVGLAHMDETTFWIVFIYFLVNCAASPALFFGTDYFGSVIYHGIADAQKGSPGYMDYQEGVRMGSLGMGLAGVINIITSVVLPRLLTYIGYRVTWAVSEALIAIAFILVVLPACQTVAISMAIIATLGITNGTAAVLPFSMVGQLDSTKDKSGLMIAILNSAQVIAQLVSNFVSSGTATLTDNDAAGIATGSGWALIAFFVTVFYLKVPESSRSPIITIDVSSTRISNDHEASLEN